MSNAQAMPKVNPQIQHEINWQNKFNELCYAIFQNTKEGQEFLTMCEHKYFYQPTAHPGKEIAWTYFNEGRNEFIRMIRNGMNVFMTKPLQKMEGKVKRAKEKAE